MRFPEGRISPELAFDVSYMRLADPLKAEAGDALYDPCQRRP